MQGTRQTRYGLGLGLAPWIVAGALLFGVGAPATAQDATPSAAGASTEAALPTTDTAAAPAADQAAAPAANTTANPAADQAADPAADTTRGGRGGGQEVSAVPATGTGPGASGFDLSLMAISAAVSAAAVGATALRGRFSSR
jgi:hypothetical protein